MSEQAQSDDDGSKRPDRLVGLRTFYDPTPKALIQNTVMLKAVEFLKRGEFTDEEGAQVINFCRLLALKLLSVWRHLDSYLAEETRLIEEAKGDPIDLNSRDPVRYVASQELFLDLDEFLVQVKSALDYLVKAPALVLGEKGWSLHTFSERGARVIRTLRGSTPSSFKQTSRMLQQVISEAREEWIESAIEARDRVNHYQRGGINPDIFIVAAAKDGDELLIQKPMWTGDQRVFEAMDIFWGQLIQFVERFLFATLGHRLPSELGVLFLSRMHVEPGQSQVRIMLIEEAKKKLGYEDWPTVPEID